MIYEKQLLIVIDTLRDQLENLMLQLDYSQNDVVDLSKKLDAYLSEYQRYTNLEKRKAEHYRKEIFQDPLKL